MEKLLEACCELPCDLAKIRSMLESNRYTPTELMHTVLEFAEHADFYNFHEFISENGRKPQKGELSIHYMHDLLALFLEFGLDPNGFDQDGENIMFFLGYMEYEYSDGYHTADCMRLLMEHGGDPDLEVDETDILATHSSRLYCTRAVPCVTSILVISDQPSYNPIVREKHFRFGRCAQGYFQHEAFA